MESSFHDDLSLFCLLTYLFYYYFDAKSHQVGQSDLKRCCNLDLWSCLNFCSWDDKSALANFIFFPQKIKLYKVRLTITLTEFTKCVSDDNIYVCTFRVLPVWVGLLSKRFLLCDIFAPTYLKERMCLCLFIHLHSTRHFLSVQCAQILPLSSHSSAEHYGLPRLS